MPYDKLIVTRAIFSGDLGKENTATRMLLLWLMFKSKDGIVKASPETMAKGLGVRLETVIKALDRLESPSSDWKESGGARIIKRKEENTWKIVRWDQTKSPGRTYAKSEIFTGLDRNHPDYRAAYMREYRKRKTEEKQNRALEQMRKRAVNKTLFLNLNSEIDEIDVRKRAVNKTEIQVQNAEIGNLRGTPPLVPLSPPLALNNPTPLPHSPSSPPSPHCTDEEKKRQAPIPRKALNLRGNPKYARLWEDFKLVYPRRLDGRAMRLGEARKIFDTLLDAGEDSTEIIMGAKRFGDYVRSTHAEKFVPMVTTWLNQRRWEEEHLVEKGSLEAKQIAMDKIDLENKRRARHHARFHEAYLGWAKESARAEFPAQKEVYRRALEESLIQRRALAGGRSSKAITAIEDALASEEAMLAAFITKTISGGDFWQWDANHNPERYAPET